MESRVSEVGQTKTGEAIYKLKNEPSRNIYDINVAIIKYIKGILMGPLTTLINLCIRQKISPKYFNCSKIVPIVKKTRP